MPRPLWTGTLSFGLLHVPVQLMPGERHNDLSLRMVDRRNEAPIRYLRVNSATGEEVAWADVAKAYEYEKDSFVMLEDSDLRAAAAEASETIELDAFVDAREVSPAYFERPYVLVPGKKAEKGYVLLRETLARTGRAGVGRLVLRTRESLCLVTPHEAALLLLQMRFPEELIDIAEYPLPAEPAAEYRVNDKELAMAEQLVESMTEPWQPARYHDEFRARLGQVIERRMRTRGVGAHAPTEARQPRERVATNVVDFMSLLQESLASKRPAPAPSKPGRAAAARATRPTKRSRK